MSHGNRTGYDHNVAGGYTTSYGRACNLSYTFDAVNALTQVTDADETRYNAALTCDANGNITQVVETYNSLSIPPSPESTLTTDFTYDALNRMTEHKSTRYVGGGVNKTQYTLRGHQYDATGRVVKSSYSQYYAGDMPSLASLEHVYAGASQVQNYDGTNYGAVWHWAGSASAHSAPLRSPNPDTASQTGYNISAGGGKGTPQRRTWLDALTEGDKRELYGQGRPMAKDSSGSGANWYLGTKSDPPVSGTAVESRFFFEGTVSATDMSRATDAREASRIGIFGTSNSYGSSYGRVTNEALGRDLNPLGRGAGYALVGGMLNVGEISPRLPEAVLGGGALGNSVNNGLPGMGGGGGSTIKGCGECCTVNFTACNTTLRPGGNNPDCDAYRNSPLRDCDPQKKLLLCKCIANGCAPDVPGCMGTQAHQMETFQRCGCAEFGSMTPFEGDCCACRPGKFFPKLGGGGGGGEGPRAMYSGGGGCCGGGGGGYSPTQFGGTNPGLPTSMSGVSPQDLFTLSMAFMVAETCLLDFLSSYPGHSGARCILHSLRSPRRFQLGGCCPRHFLFDQECCLGCGNPPAISYVRAFKCSGSGRIVLCPEVTWFAEKGWYGVNNHVCEIAHTILHELAHVCGLEMGSKQEPAASLLNEADAAAYAILRCCVFCS